MKLIKVFVAFVVISLFVGIGSAFNGQPIQENLAEATNQQEVTEEEKKNENTDEQIVETKMEKENEPTTIKENKATNSFSESKKNTISSETAKVSKDVPKTETPKSQKHDNTNAKVDSKSNSLQSEQKQEITKESTNNTPQPKINDSDIMHSITKGRTEFSDESECYARGLYIQNKEMDSILDWNEKHPEEMKQPLIDNSICYPIVKDGKEYWYLHFKTTEGNKDDELKQLYK